MRNPYEILGLNPGANLDEIKIAYREKAIQYHPDRNPEDTAKEKFIEVTEAYVFLKNSKNIGNVVLSIKIPKTKPQKEMTLGEFFYGCYKIIINGLKNEEPPIKSPVRNKPINIQT